jgi:hypothetical protein
MISWHVGISAEALVFGGAGGVDSRGNFLGHAIPA